MGMPPVTDGTARDRRQPFALAQGYVRPQERTLHDHLAAAARNAALIRLPGGEGPSEQTWAALFAREPAVAMAELLALRGDDLRLRFEAALERDPVAALARIAELAAGITRLRGVLLAAGEAALVARMDAVDEDAFAGRTRSLLSPRTVGILALVASQAAAGPGGLGLAVTEARRPDLGLLARGRLDPLAAVAAARDGLGDAFGLLLNLATALRPVLLEAFEARLASGRIDPALGLLIAQFRMLAAAEARLNCFAERHADFYYRDILGQAPRAAVPDTLILQLMPAEVPVEVEEGALVLGRVPGMAEPQCYRLLDSVRVVPARVGASRTLVYQRNAAISRQSQLSFVTAVRSRADGLDGRPAAEPIFSADSFNDVDLGIDIRSNILMLAEGRREISVRLTLAPLKQFELPPMDQSGQVSASAGQRLRMAVADALRSDRGLSVAYADAGPDTPATNIAMTLANLASARDADARSDRDLFYRACLAHADTAAKVSSVYGRIVIETLVEGQPWPKGALRASLLERIGACLGAPSAAARSVAAEAVAVALAGAGTESGLPGAAARADAEEWFALRPEDVYQQFLSGGFAVQLSTAAGPFPVQSARALPDPGKGPGLRIHMVLEPSAPPVEPGPGESAPVMSIRMAGESLFCPFSLFEPYALASIGLSVDVTGVGRLAGFSDDGPLDLSKAFFPFGARPRDGATLLVGARELALKSVTGIGADIVWSVLPRGAGGFAAHYRDYGPDFDVPDPSIRLDYLTADGWRPLGDGAEAMFGPAIGTVGLSPLWHQNYTVPGPAVTAQTGTSVADFTQRQRIGAGLLRLTLDCPGQTFGHAAYPAALAQALRPSLVPLRKRAIPQEPFTPEIAAISLSYAATETIVLDKPGEARPDQRVIQLRPFGLREIYPERNEAGAGIFAPRFANGALFLRLEGRALHGEVSLAFVMEDASHQRVSFPPEPVAWHFLSLAGWQPLPKWSVEADSTDGFMRSGVVRLEIPDTAVTTSPEMPGEGIWLALTAEERLAAFPRLRIATVNGAVVTRNDIAGDAEPGPIPTTWFLDPARPGITGIEALGATIAGHPPELPAAFRTRIGEHLRHRKRGVTAWDIERLVLEAFPQVWKCKCFPATQWRRTEPVAGAVSVVVVPTSPADAANNPSQPRMFDVLTLRRIDAHLQDLCGPFTAIEVNNASFERFQVRARVGFPRSGDEGSLTQRLKLDLSKYLSVWTAQAPLDGFGWSLNVHDVGAFMAGLDYVEHFSGLSVLQLVERDDGTWRLLDTARADPGTGSANAMLAFRSPWALALSLREHWIVPARDRFVGDAVATGIGGLMIGQTLVIDRR